MKEFVSYVARILLNEFHTHGSKYWKTGMTQLNCIYLGHRHDESDMESIYVIQQGLGHD